MVKMGDDLLELEDVSGQLLHFTHHFVGLPLVELFKLADHVLEEEVQAADALVV